MVSAFLLGCCFELYDAVVSGVAVLALSADSTHTPLCFRFAEVLFSTKPWTFLYLFMFVHIFSRTTQHGNVVLV